MFDWGPFSGNRSSEDTLGWSLKLSGDSCFNNNSDLALAWLTISTTPTALSEGAVTRLVEFDVTETAASSFFSAGVDVVELTNLQSSVRIKDDASEPSCTVSLNAASDASWCIAGFRFNVCGADQSQHY